MRRPIITQAWLADFYAEGVKPKYKGSLKRQATSRMHPYLEAASYKHQAPSEDRKSPQASSDKQQASCDLNPSLTRDKILVPGNNLKEP